MRVRNENQRIEVKFFPHRRHQLRNGNPLITETKSTDLCKLPLVPRNIDSDYEKIAIGFFFHHYAEGSHVKYLRDLFRPDMNLTTLYKTVAAVSLMCFSFSRADPRLQRDARSKYIQALAEVNMALQRHPNEIGNDVVASILLLGLFVALSSGKNEASEHWSIHVNGALSVMMLGTKERSSCPTRQKLLYHVLSMKQIDCMQRGIVIPMDLLTLYRSSLAGDYQTQFWETLHELALLRATCSSNENISKIIINERFNKLNERISQLRKDLPSALNASAFERHQTPIFDALSIDLESVRAHNTLRMMQLLVLETYESLNMHTEAQDIPDHPRCLSPEFQETLSLVEKISVEILGSVSVWCNQIRKQVNNRSSMGVWGQSFIWPLVIVGRCPLLSTPVRNLASQYLSTIAETACLPEALAATVRLKSGSHAEGWSHALYLS